MLKILELFYFRAVVSLLLSCKEEKTCNAFYLSKLLLFVYFFLLLGAVALLLVKTARKAPHVMSLASVVTICGYNQAVNLDKETQTED